MEKKEYDAQIKRIKEEKTQKLKELNSKMWELERKAKLHHIKKLSVVLVSLVIVSFILSKIIDTTFLVTAGFVVIILGLTRLRINSLKPLLGRS